MLVRLAIGAVIALFSLFQYFSSSSINPVTGEKQRIRMTPQQEVALGRQQAPLMAREFGGLHPDPQARQLVAAVGARLVNHSIARKSGYPFSFNLLADHRTVNAFALPGGPIFITAGLLSRLKTEGQLAGVLGHEVGHVIGRHSAEQMSKSAMISGMANAAILTGIDPTGGIAASGIAKMKQLEYGRDDETEADELGVQLMVQAGYDPRALVEVMKILAAASGGAGRVPEFMSSHPNPLGRAEHIAKYIRQKYPNGLPPGLKP